MSTEEQAQEGFSIRAQTQKLKDYTRIKDWTLYKIYADEGISGKDIKGRPAIQEMLEDVKSGAVKNVLVFKIDRLTRSTADLIYLVDLFNQHDCAFSSLMESIDTKTASGRMFLKIIGIFAEFERENIIERTRVGVERKVKEGYSLCTAHPSFGYDRPKHQKIQTVNDEEADIVREIFHLYVDEGSTLIDIARRLNLQGILTKGGKRWDGTKIRRVLANCNYVGDVRHHMADKKHATQWDGLHDAIISQELFDTAAALMTKNKRTSPKKQPDYDKYFSGFLVCGGCGYRLKTYETHKQLKTRAQKTSGYVCGNKTLGTCPCGSMSHKKVEAAFEAYIERVADFDMADESLLAEQTQKTQDHEAQIQSYESTLRQLDGKEKEALEMYVRNQVDFEDYRQIKKQIDSDRQFIAAELKRLRLVAEETSIDNRDVILNFQENWSLLSQPERRSFLRMFVEKIEIVSEKSDGAFFGTVSVLHVVWKP